LVEGLPARRIARRFLHRDNLLEPAFPCPWVAAKRRGAVARRGMAALRNSSSLPGELGGLGVYGQLDGRGIPDGLDALLGLGAWASARAQAFRGARRVSLASASGLPEFPRPDLVHADHDA